MARLNHVVQRQGNIQHIRVDVQSFDGTSITLESFSSCAHYELAYKNQNSPVPMLYYADACSEAHTDIRSLIEYIFTWSFIYIRSSCFVLLAGCSCSYSLRNYPTEYTVFLKYLVFSHFFLSLSLFSLTIAYKQTSTNTQLHIHAQHSKTGSPPIAILSEVDNVLI